MNAITSKYDQILDKLENTHVEKEIIQPYVNHMVEMKKKIKSD